MCPTPDFNPRSREGSDIRRGSERDRQNISIHAPVKGATTCRPFQGQKRGYFNPRSREGSDNPGKMLFLAIDISIHAPVKGATWLLPRP